MEHEQLTAFVATTPKQLHCSRSRVEEPGNKANDLSLNVSTQSHSKTCKRSRSGDVQSLS